MLRLNKVFADKAIPPKIPVPTVLPVLHPRLWFWAEQLSEYVGTIMILEDALGASHPAIRAMLKGGDDLWAQDAVHILQALARARSIPEEGLMQAITGRLSSEGRSASDVYQCLRALPYTNPKGLDVCQRIFDLDSDKDLNVPKAVKEILVAGSLQDEEITVFDEAAIKALASLIGLEVYEIEVPTEKLVEAMQYYEEQEVEIMEEAVRDAAAQ